MGAISYIAEYNRFRDFLKENGCEEAFDRAFAAGSWLYFYYFCNN